MDSVKLSDYSSDAALVSLHQTLTQTTHQQQQHLEHSLYSTPANNTVTTTTNSTNSMVATNKVNATPSATSSSSSLGSSSATSSASSSSLSSTTSESKKCHVMNNDIATTSSVLEQPEEVNQKTLCCLTIPSALSAASTPMAATMLPTSDLSRDPWYTHAHMHHHHHHHPSATSGHHHHHQHQLTEELVMYGPAAAAASIGKFGLDHSTEGYLNARYNVNVKGARHERTTFFDLPAVTHPYCYRFPSSPPAAGILKKNDEEQNFCANTSPASSTANAIGGTATATLQLGGHQAFHSSKTEHPDSTTSHHLNHLSHPHHHSSQTHAAHAHQLTHAAHIQSNHLHSQHQSHLTSHSHHHHPAHSSAFKFSASSVIATSSPSVYQHYNTAQSAYNLRDLSPSLATIPAASTTSDTNDVLKYESPYNSAISTTYALRPATVDSSTATVTSTDEALKYENLYASNSISTSQTVNQRRGSLQLWQFLVALLDEPTTSSSCIAWTGRGMEFKLIEPEEVARRWGIQKNRPAMNYDKLSRSLRYYYEKGIMQKVNGERYVYRFVCDPDALFNMAYGHLANSATKSEHGHLLTAATTASLTKSMENLRNNSSMSSIVSSLQAEDISRERSLVDQLQANNSKQSDAHYYSSTLHKF